MTQQDLQALAQIYNSLLTIKVNGDDIFTMADCMKAFRSFIYTKQDQLSDKKEEEKDG